jgi:peptidoglycan/LPS O-acetylase OafA/YrhL
MATAQARLAEQRIPALDGLRAIASLMVVVYHFGPHIVRDPGSRFWFLNSIPRRGDEGVNLFFVLSGFLISGILINARNSPRYFSTFYARRAFRIFPLYYLVFLAYCLVLAVWGARTAAWGRLFENPLPVWAYAGYLQNFVMAAASTYGPIWLAGTWSLAIEEQFYFTFPAIVKNISDRTLVWLTGFGITGPILLRASIQRFRFIPQLSNRVLLPTAVDSLAVGIMVMLLLRFHSNWLNRHRREIGWAVSAALIAWFIYPAIPNPMAIRLAFLNDTFTALVSGGALLYLLIAPAGPVSRFLSLRWMRVLGNMAYSTYLFHPIVLCVVFRLLVGADPRLNTLADLGPLAAALALSLLISRASWEYFEKPLISRGRRFVY